MHDMVIRGDGTGADPVMANIATDGDRITVVGTLVSVSENPPAL